MFGTINIAGMAMFALLLPETKGRSLEEMDIVFGSVSAEKRNADIQKEERALDHEVADGSLRSEDHVDEKV